MKQSNTVFGLLCITVDDFVLVVFSRGSLMKMKLTPTTVNRT